MIQESLGVQLLFPVRCMSCMKLLGHLDQDYNAMVKSMENEINQLIFELSTMDISEDEKTYRQLYSEQFGKIFSQLGISRYCCRVAIRYPQQIATGTMQAPTENIALTRYNSTSRNPTIIYLSKKSRTPGGSNVLMMSVTGQEDLSGYDKMLRSVITETGMRTGLSNDLYLGSKDIMPQSVPSAPNLNLLSNTPSTVSIPSIMSPSVSGNFTPVSRKPKLKNVEIVTTDFMELDEPETFSIDTNVPELEQTDLMSLEKLNLSE